MTSTFPSITSILSPDALKSEVLPGFGLENVSECVFYCGGFNHTYRVKANTSQTYYLRAYRKEWRALEDIQFELDVLVHLQHKNFPAARPVQFHDGQFFCAIPALEGTRYLALFAECPGPEISYDDAPTETAQRYGKSVAEMHAALDDFSSSHRRFQKDLAHFIDMPLKTIEPFLQYRSNDWEYFQFFANKVREKILELPAANLEQGVCHGDLQGYHAKVDPEGTLAFYDFDCGGYGYRAYDLAVFLWCCRLEEAIDTRWEPFLSAYRETRPMSDLDIQAVPLFICCRYLWHMGVHAQNSPDWGIEFLNDRYFDTHLKRLRAAEADYLK